MTQWLSFLLMVGAVAGCAASPSPPTTSARDLTTTDGLKTRSPQSLFQAGRSYAERGDTVRAEQYLQLAISRGYARSEALPLLMRVCVSSGRLRAALNYAEPELRDQPDNSELRHLVASIRLGLGQAREAREELVQLLRFDPDHARALYLLGLIEAQHNDDLEAAKRCFAHYLEIEPRGMHAPEVRSLLEQIDRRSHAISPNPAAAQAERDSSSSWFGANEVAP